MQLQKNPLARNVRLSSSTLSCCSEGGAPNSGSSILLEREMQKQHFRCQGSRFLQNNKQQEMSRLSQMTLSGGFGGSSGCTGLDFGGNLAEMTNHRAVNEMSMKSNTYGNFSKPLQLGFDQISIQTKLRSDVSLSHTFYHLSCAVVVSHFFYAFFPSFLADNILTVPNSNLSTLGFNGSYGDVNPHGTQLNFGSNPAWFRNNLSFHNTEPAPQVPEVSFLESIGFI